MWKNFFYFSKGQRIGIIVLIVLIIIVLIANFALPLLFSREEMPKNAFLSLMGQNNRRSKNGTYAMEALDIIDKLGKDDIDNISPNKFWRDYMGKEISHNHQIDVVFALRSKGYV